MRTLKDNLLELAEIVLQEVGGPMHYKQLTRQLIELDLWEGSGKEPDQVLFSRMHNDIKRRGNDSAFRMMGGGIFCASTVRCVDDVAVPAAEIQARCKPRDKDAERDRRRPGESQGEHAERLATRDEARLCGNCSHLDFEQMYVLTQRRGICHNYSESRRCGVAVGQQACPFWARRADAQRRRDRVIREATLEAMAKANKETRGAKRK